MPRRLTTVPEVLDVLGGITAVADLTGTKRSAVSMWRTLNKFPANRYLLMVRVLEQRGYTAPPSLWGQEAA